MKIKEMRAMPVSEAEMQVAELRAELAKERSVAAGGTRPENPTPRYASPMTGIPCP